MTEPTNKPVEVKRQLLGPKSDLGLTVDQTFEWMGQSDKYDAEYQEPAKRSSRACATCAFFKQTQDVYNPWLGSQGCMIVRDAVSHQGTCAAYINGADAIAAVMLNRLGIQRASIIPPEAVQLAAKEGIALYEKYGRGSTRAAYMRARLLASAAPVSPEFVETLHEVAELRSAGKNENPEEGNGKIAWLLNGGDAGSEWAMQIHEQYSMDKEESKIEMSIKIVRAAVEGEKRLTYGVVYAPNEVDSHGTWMAAEDIERTAHEFMAEVRRMGYQHEVLGIDCDIVESYIAPIDMEFTDITGAVQKVQRGSWMLVQRVNDDTVWEQIKKGEINAYSIGGVGVVIDNELPNG